MHIGIFQSHYDNINLFSLCSCPVWKKSTFFSQSLSECPGTGLTVPAGPCSIPQHQKMTEHISRELITWVGRGGAASVGSGVVGEGWLAKAPFCSRGKSLQGGGRLGAGVSL